ncbi:MAG: tyrosine-type recombinase/integrase [Bacteroidota bacterium]
MASLRKRNGTYSVVFSRRREDGKLEQKVFSLGTKKKSKADKLKDEYGERYRLGEIDPFGGWHPKADLEAKRKRSVGRTLKAMGEAFMESRSHVRKPTWIGYRQQLSQLTEHIRASMPVGHITEDDIRKYAFKPGLSVYTQTTYLRFCKMLFKWLREEGFIATDPTARIAYPRKDTRLSGKVMSEEEFYMILAAFKREQRTKIKEGQVRGLHKWFKPFAMTGLYAGLRRKELVGLDWKHVDLAEGMLYITSTKSGDERTVPMRSALKPVLAAWHRAQKYPTSGPVFYYKCVQGCPVPLNNDHVTSVFKYYVRAAGVKDSVSLHSLRHTSVTELLRGGLGDTFTMKYHGHKSSETMKPYNHITAQDIQNRLDEVGL